MFGRIRQKLGWPLWVAVVWALVAIVAPVPVAAQTSVESTPISAEELAEYQVALFLLGSGAFEEAAQVLALLVAAHPDELVLRRNYAAALYRAGLSREARAQLLILQRTDRGPGRGQEYRVLLARLADARPVKLRFGVALTPSTNINGATSSDTINTIFGRLRIDEQAVGGVGLDLNATLTFRLPALHENSQTIASFTLGTTAYTAQEYNRSYAKLALTHQIRAGRVGFAIEPSVTRTVFREPGSTATRAQISLSASSPVTEELLLQGAFDLGHAWYDEDSSNAQSGGPLRRFRGAAIWKATPRYALTGTWSVTSLRPDLTHFRSLGWELGTSVDAQVADDWRLSFGVFGGMTDYEGVFPGVPTARHDHHFGLSIGAQTRAFRIFGEMPRLTCRARRSFSNVPIYDNRNLLECGVRLSQNF